MASGKNTPEYQKVKKSFPKLTSAISGVIGPTCEQLLAAGLITNGQKAKAKNGMIDASDRASELVSLILDKVAEESRNFYTFVDVLREDLDSFRAVLNHMGVSTDDSSAASDHTHAPGVSAATCPVAFSDALSPPDLVIWLSQQLQAKGLTLDSSVGKKLIDDEINGEAFMDYDDKDLEETGFKKGQRKNILKIIQSIKDGKEEKSSGDHNGATSKPVQEEKKVEAPSDAPVLTILTLTRLKGKDGKEVEIMKAVTPEWQRFGQFLDFDAVGSDLDTIGKRNSDPADCCKEMFQHWLKGNGIAATWVNVIDTLGAIGLKALAKDVKAIISSY